MAFHPMEPFTGNVGYDDEIYFCEGACVSTSYSGVFPDEEGKLDSDLSEWVRGSNWALYRRLNGMPVSSSGDHVEVVSDGLQKRSWDAQDGVKLFGKDIAASSVKFSEPQSKGCEMTPRVNNEVEHQILQSMVIGDRLFTLLRSYNQDFTYYCSRLTCRRKSQIISGGEVFGCVADKQHHDLRGKDCLGANTIFYCFECVKEVFEQHHAGGRSLFSGLQAFDGTREPSPYVLNAAERLHPLLDAKTLPWMYLPEEPPLEHGVGSNSKKGLRLRRQKQYDIVRILQEINSTDRLKMAIPSPSGENSLLHVSHDWLPFRERYKKQGLTWSDRSKQQRGWKSAVRNIEAIDMGKNVKEQDHRGDHYCFCRDTTHQEAMLTCSSENCMFGQIHFRCSGLGQLPSEGEHYVCKNCNECEEIALVSQDKMLMDTSQNQSAALLITEALNEVREQNQAEKHLHWEIEEQGEESEWRVNQEDEGGGEQEEEGEEASSTFAVEDLSDGISDNDTEEESEDVRGNSKFLVSRFAAVNDVLPRVEY